MARILIVAGGCRGLHLAARLTRDGYAVRVTTRDAAKRGAIEAAGAEAWTGAPDRLATMRGVLDSVTVAVWALAGATGPQGELDALHGDRLHAFLMQAIDSTVRGFLYETNGGAAGAGEAVARQLCDANAIPFALLHGDAGDAEAWAGHALTAIRTLLVAA
ncbi:MAG TPA: hypothetical protein VMA83_12605 [Solirubrobacteraceae bacterium]|nr:hypothetical protein [Solirubrobacteraceae bacterium]